MNKWNSWFVFMGAIVGAVLLGVNAQQFQQTLFSVIARIVNGDPTQTYAHRNAPFAIAAVTVFGFIVGAALGTVGARFFRSLGRRWDRMAASDKVNFFLSIIAGIIGSLPIYILLQSVFQTVSAVYAPLVTLLLIFGLSLMAYYALRSMDEVLPWSNVQGKPKNKGFKILDTNVIIDGRIYDVARSGFLEGQLYVPKFVLEEIQHIADSADPLRRQRGRRGLDVLHLLQAEFPLEVGSYDRVVPDGTDEVDAKLVHMAKALGGDLVTNDMNLNRVAALQKVRVLNLNDLAMAVKPNVLPKETLTVPIVKEGNQPGQGVGYLDDGTMVVVENGRSFVNTTIEVMVTQIIQTERGKMIFAEAPGDAVEAVPEPQPKRRPRRQDS